MKRLWWLAIFCCALVSQTAQTLDLAEFERGVLELTNQRRSENGCTALAADPRLAELARRHSRNMAEQDFFAHTDPWGRSVDDRRREYYPQLLHLGMGENLFTMENSRRIFTPEDAMSSWMESPGHRANILKPEYTHLGVGIWVAGNKLWATQVFAIPLVLLGLDGNEEFRQGQTVRMECEYLSTRPVKDFAGMLRLPDSTAVVMNPDGSYYTGVCPLTPRWAKDNRFWLDLPFLYGPGEYELTLGWNGMCYQDLYVFRIP